jgi:hypothetical protein
MKRKRRIEPSFACASGPNTLAGCYTDLKIALASSCGLSECVETNEKFNHFTRHTGNDTVKRIGSP